MPTIQQFLCNIWKSGHIHWNYYSMVLEFSVKSQIYCAFHINLKCNWFYILSSELLSLILCHIILYRAQYLLLKNSSHYFGSDICAIFYDNSNLFLYLFWNHYISVLSQLKLFPVFFFNLTYCYVTHGQRLIEITEGKLF